MPGKTFVPLDVLEAARRRMRFIFDRFDTVVSCISGGKDGHVVFELAYAEAQRRGRILHAAYLDQELELQSTIDVISENMRRPGVVPLWYQVPMADELFISVHGGVFEAWEPGKTWMRAKEPIAIHEPPPGFPASRANARVEDAWTNWRDWHSANMGESCAILIGDRADETNTRYFLVTGKGALPGVRWSRQFSPGAPTFYPIYDWSADDVWSYLVQHQVSYNRFYDYYHKVGMPVSKQRAGYLMSRNSFKRMADVQAFEPDTFDRLVERTAGLASVAARYGREDSMFRSATALPTAFTSWMAWRNFLLAEMPEAERALFANRFARAPADEAACRLQVRQLMVRDVQGFHSLAKPASKPRTSTTGLYEAL